MLKSISIVVSGKVQGVFYRQSTKEKAGELGITGEVKNTPDGKVLIKATGTAEQLDQLVAWCRTGPRKAIVEYLAVTEIQPEHFTGFSIIR